MISIGKYQKENMGIMEIYESMNDDLLNYMKTQAHKQQDVFINLYIAKIYEYNRAWNELRKTRNDIAANGFLLAVKDIILKSGGSEMLKRAAGFLTPETVD